MRSTSVDLSESGMYFQVSKKCCNKLYMMCFCAFVQLEHFFSLCRLARGLSYANSLHELQHKGNMLMQVVMSNM